MKTAIILGLLLFAILKGGECDESVIEPMGSYFYKELGCTKKEGGALQYECPDLSLKNDSCQFKNDVLKIGDSVNEEYLKGSCHADCYCAFNGKIRCAHYDCFESIKPGCLHLKSSLDSCCGKGSVCDSAIKCEVDGKSYNEGQFIHPANTCDICVCDKNFEKKAPFCRPRKCLDQAGDYESVATYGAPVFFKDNKCCPDIWTTDEGEEIVKIGDTAAASTSDLSCTYGKKKVGIGYGFKKSVQPYGRKVSLKCECTIPPFVICSEAE